MDGGVEVFPDKSVVLHIPAQHHITTYLNITTLPHAWTISNVDNIKCGQYQTWTISKKDFLSLVLLDKVLLGDDARAEIANPVHRNNSNVLNCTQ